MFAKSLLVAAVSASLASAYSIPACWETCFQKYDIQSEGCLCSAPMESVVTSCISVGCPASNATESATTYESWLSSYCGESTGPVTVTAITTDYTTVCPATMTSGSVVSTSGWTTSTVSTVITSTSTGVWSTTVPVVTSYPISTVTTSTGVWTSTISSGVSVSTSVVTSVVTSWSSGVWTTTITPGANTWTGPASVAPPATTPVAPYPTSPASTWSAPSGTGVSSGWPATTPAPYVAGAAGLKVGGILGAVGAVAALVL